MYLTFVGGKNHGLVYDVFGDSYEVPIMEPIRAPSPEELETPVKDIVYKRELYKRHIIRDGDDSLQLMIINGWNTIDAMHFLLEEIVYNNSKTLAGNRH